MLVLLVVEVSPEAEVEAADNRLAPTFFIESYWNVTVEIKRLIYVRLKIQEQPLMASPVTHPPYNLTLS